MHKNIYVNLPVKDLDKSKEFFEKMGYTFNPQFTDETAAGMQIGEHIYAMLLTHSKAKEFTKKEIADAHVTTEVLNAVDVESKEEVDNVMQKALDAGANEVRDAQDLGFMYSRAFEDLDGHIWELVWMNPDQLPQ